MYREKINEFIRTIAQSNDIECLDLMEDLISSASDYVRRVNVLEIGLMVGKYNKEGAEYREYIEKLDKQRSEVHNALITNVKIINRLCRKNNLPLIYQGNEEERVEIAEFAQQVVDELFSSRRL
jgi:carboxylesterase type B